MITDWKYECNRRRLGKDFDKFLIVSFYRDGKMAVAEIRDKDMKQTVKNCNYTTLVKGESKEKTHKVCYLFPQRIKLKKNSNGKWTKV